LLASRSSSTAATGGLLAARTLGGSSLEVDANVGDGGTMLFRR
jgi:hypothetical protein